MYLGIDVGGTKTLVATLTDEGEIVEQLKSPTPHDYQEFLDLIKTTIGGFKDQDFKAGGAGLPARINRQTETIINMGNLPWHGESILKDLENVCGCPMVVENDGKMGGLGEAWPLRNTYKKVLYVAIGTGIGVALIDNDKIEADVSDAGGRSLMLEHQGKLVPWESFAGGRAIGEKYGPAHDIDDEATWKIICHYLGQGLIHYIAIMEPEAIVIGGSVGTYFDKYGAILEAELKSYEIPLITLPKLLGAQHAEQAVIYGCYHAAKQTFNHHD